MHDETAVRQLGIEFTEIGEDFLRGTMEVDGRTRQPMGVLHGGATVVLAESLGSIGGSMCVDGSKFYCVGLSITANHLRAARSGKVTGTARPVHLGRTTQVWDIQVVDEQDRLVNVSRLTLAVLAL
jgi:uncharacterized protein (TIGR00369 family)